MKTRKEALDLLNEYVNGESLRKHCFSVASAMEGYARVRGKSEKEVDEWWICGLLHDFDFEKFPVLQEHAFRGAEILRERGFDEEIIQAVLGHSNHTGVKRESEMAKVLFAVDELCGLIVALSYVRPGKFEGMTGKSVRKAMKKKGFAEAVNREDIKNGVEDLGVKWEDVDDVDEFIGVVIEALSKDENLR